MEQTRWICKLWIYGTLLPDLFRSSFETGGTALDIWVLIENKFCNNKEARAIQLDNEHRTTEIGDQTIEAYSQKLKSLSDHLANVDSPSLIVRLLPISLMVSTNASTTSLT